MWYCEEVSIAKRNKRRRLVTIFTTGTVSYTAHFRGPRNVPLSGHCGCNGHLNFSFCQVFGWHHIKFSQKINSYQLAHFSGVLISQRSCTVASSKKVYSRGQVNKEGLMQN